MKKNAGLLMVFLSMYLVLLGLAYIVFKIDIATHGWLKTAALEWRWWNYFTSGHTLTVMIINHPWVIFILPVVPSTILFANFVKD